MKFLAEVLLLKREYLDVENREFCKNCFNNATREPGLVLIWNLNVIFVEWFVFTGV